MHSLGTGETFEIEPVPNGYVDLASGLTVHVEANRITVPSLPAVVDFKLSGDIGFDGYDHSSDEWFSGRAGGGASVTLYDRDERDYFQYAVAVEGDRS
jgi:hypothetical protein